MMFIESVNTFSTRIRSINQLVILSFLEFSFVCYLLIHFKYRHYGIIDIVTIIILAGLLQSMFAISAFLIPQLRSLYMMFGDSTLYSNIFFIERRGYGFSINLIDTFGYGMGLIAGYAILVKWTNNRLFFILSIILLLFTITVNARTGLIVFTLAIIVKLFSKKSLKKVFFNIFYVTVFAVIIYSNIPHILELGRNSDNTTISWISNSFSEMYYLLDLSTSNSSLKLDEVDFLDNFIGLPTNLFEYLFGTGHHVYDTGNTLGFRTDIGYYNLFWEFGVLGGIGFLICLAWFMGYPIILTNDYQLKRIAIFNLIAYFIVMMKAILLGFNPGCFINYLSTFSLYYCINYQICKRIKFNNKKFYFRS